MSIPMNPGDILLGKYRIEKVLGKGGMGIVVAVQHVELGQRYAIKFLLPTVQAHPAAVERFLREARAAARLHSEHVARVHDVGYLENGLPYMVMEYLEGADLQATLHKEGPLSSELALTYLDQVCDAIAEAHAAGIVHRDLKPANLFLIRRRNGTPCVKVLDFGISKHLDANHEVDLTSTNATIGSPLYMSPEQISKSKSVDTRTDIWALGVILYELVTGTSPFLGTTALEVVARILQEEPVPIRLVRPEVSERAEGVIAGCLRKRREERFQTIEELQAYLQKGSLPFAQTAENIADTAVAPKPSAPSLPSIPETPNLNAPAAVTASAPVITTGPTSVAFGQTQPLPAPQPRKRTGLAIAAAAIAVVFAGALFVITNHFNESKDAAPASSAIAATPASATAAATSAIPAAPPVEPKTETEMIAPSATTSAITGSKTIATSTAAPNRDTSPTTPTKKKRSAL